MSEELKPCPFCGGAPLLKYSSGNENINQSWWVKCSAQLCGAKGIGFSGSNTWEPSSAKVKKKDEDARAKAIAWWNRRPQEES